MNDAASTEASLGSGAYTQRGMSLVRGEGTHVWDASGNRYLDCITGHGAAILGHAHPALMEAINSQSRKLISCSNSFSNDVRADFLLKLTRVLSRTGADPFGGAFLCNSGTEAVEGALKFARFQTGKPGIVAMKNGFHGRTLGALSLTWRKKYREPFQPLIPQVTHITFNDAEAAREVITEEVGAVVVEPVQGEGGVIEADPEWLALLRELCDSTGARLVFDEVQTGFGRTGNWFAFHHSGVMPDMVAMAKGIAGGVPMGAVAVRSGLEKFTSGAHGSTFGGNPLACAAGLAVIRTLREEGLVERSRQLGLTARDFLREQFRDTRMVREIRGRGLMIGLQLRRRVTPVLKALMERGILAMPAGATVLRLLPPLTIAGEELEYILETIVKILDGRMAATAGREEESS